MPATPLYHRSPAMTPTGYRTPRSGYASPSGYQTPSGGYGTPSVSCNYSKYTNRNYLSLPTGDRLAQSACSSRRASVCRDTMYINEDPYKDIKSVSGELLNVTSTTLFTTQEILFNPKDKQDGFKTGPLVSNEQENHPFVSSCLGDLNIL